MLNTVCCISYASYGMEYALLITNNLISNTMDLPGYHYSKIYQPLKLKVHDLNWSSFSNDQTRHVQINILEQMCSTGRNGKGNLAQGTKLGKHPVEGFKIFLILNMMIYGPYNMSHNWCGID